MSYTSGLTRSGGMRGGFESFSDIASEASVASQWTLEELKHEGKNFLLDKQTSIVYRDTDDNQWPEPVGKLVGGRIQFRSRQGAGQLFEALDRLLKERRVKFSQLFREYDADGSGGLDANELSRLVTELLPNVTSSEQRYFRAMIDTDGDGVVTQEEFLSSAKECMEAEAKAKARDSTDVMDVLQRMSNWLAGHKADAKRLFNQCDVRRSGHLEPAELLKFFRAAVPSMSPKQLRFLMSHVHHVDQSGDGTYAFAELMQTLRAVELRTPNAQQSKYTGFGTTPPPGGGYAPSVPSPRPTTPMSPLGAGGAATSPYDWTLQELRHTDGRTYLLDAQTSLVYSQMTQQAGGWPKVIGKLEGGRLVMATKPDVSLFTEVDRYLKTEKYKFKDLFNRYDRDESGVLSSYELRLLVRDLLPRVTEGQLNYLQVMLDVDGDGSVTQEEFLSVARTALAAESVASREALDPQVKATLDQVSSFLSKYTTNAEVAFKTVDSNGRGSLAYPDLGRALKRMIPGLSQDQIRHVVAYLFSQDVYQQGAVTFKELMRLLKATPLRMMTASGTQVMQVLSTGFNTYQTAPAPTTTSYSSGGVTRPLSSPASSVQSMPQSSAGGGSASWDPTRRTSTDRLSISSGPLKLEPLSYGGESYLLDPRTNVVYTVPHPGGWPQPVGRWDPVAGSLRTRKKDTATSLFRNLDNYLRGYQVKFKEMFNAFDADRNGWLDGVELATLVKKLLPAVTDGDVKYLRVMIDADGDGRITYDEFLSAAKACMEDEQKAVQRVDATVRQVLHQVSDYLRRHRETVQALFDRYDLDHNRALEPVEVARLLRETIPGISATHMRYVMTHLHEVDLNGDGLITLQELMVALRAVDVQTPQGLQTGGFLERTGSLQQQQQLGGQAAAGMGQRPGTPGSMSSASSYPAGHRTPTAAGGYGSGYGGDAPVSPTGSSFSGGEWLLEDFEAHGQRLLRDPATNYVYTPAAPDNGGWPELYGKMDPTTGQLVARPRAAIADLFSRLDSHLQTYRVKFQQLFNEFDADRNGYLDAREFNTFIRRLMPETRPADVAYYASMIDANGDGAITAQEFLSAAADCMHAAQAITDYAQNPEVVAALDTACQRVLANPQRIRQLFNEVDMNRSGSLEPVELAAFFRRVVPELQAQHMRYLMAYVRYMDLDQDGRISWQEVLRSLHVVAPKLRSTGAPIAQTGFRTVDAAAAAAGGYGPSVALSPRRSSGTITASPLNLDWQLESVAAGRKRYLVDRSVIPPALYDDVASAAEWPALAGRLVGGSMQFVDSSAYAKLFASLDAYLKTNRVKFSQLFDSFVAKGRPAAGYGRRAPPPPAPGQGTLDMDQLYALVSHIMPGTTPAQLKFFHAMMDANGDGVISQKEFLDAAGECLKQSADQAADVAAQPVLQQVSDALYRDPSNTQRVFDSVDKARTGALEYPGLVIFFRYISGGKSVAEVRQLLSHMARCDVSGKGAFSLMDVLKAMRAVNLRTVVHGPHARGFLPPGGMMSSHHGGDGGYQQHQQQQALSRWVLTDFRAAGQPPLLLDEESRVLYSRPATLADWPQAVGRLDGRNRPVLLQDATASARAFFSALDEYLKTNRMRLRDLFVKYDANRSGTLDMGELSRLVQTLLPQAGRGTLSYFSAMAAGYGGDNMQLSYDEFLDLIKECVKLEEAAMHGALSPDMLAALAGVSDFLIGNRASAQRLFEAADSNRDGRLQYGELAALFRRLMPNITTQQLRTIMAQAHTIDVDGDGTISFNELLQALRAVELHTSLGVHATGFGSATVTGSGKQHALQEMKGFGSMIRDSAPGAASDLPAVIDSLQLETVTSRAKTYCVDRATGTAYNNVEKEEWPQALGKYNSRSRSVELRSTPTTSALFAALDEALRIQKQRLKQLFDRYDRDGSGGLDPSELGTLLRDLLGRTKVSDADSAYFQSMLDENRDRAITLAELMSLAKASLTQQRAAQDVRAEPMAQLMREVQGRLRADPENALQLWMRCDTSRARNGLLTYPQLRSFFTSLVPDLAIAEERSLLTRMHDCDHSGTGAFHFNDVLIAFRAIAITTPAMRRDAFYERAGGAQQQQDANRGLGRSNTLRAAQTPRGRDADAAFEANFGNDGRRRGGPTLDVAPRDRNRSDPSPPDMRTVWTLKAMKVDGERVLVDPNTRCVYEYTENASRGWPRLIGKLAPDDDGALLPLPGATGGGGTSDLFGALDEFLKKNRRRLREVFDQVDADGSGCLSAAELADLVVALLPDATEAQLRYFQVMLDYDGDGRITYEEFVQAIRDCRSAGAAARGKDSVELADVMAKAAAAVAGDRQRAWDVFQRFDADEDGVLDSRELARFFKAVLPGLTAAEVRMLLAHAYELDVNGDGYLDFNELLLALRAVSIQLPGAGKQVVQGTWGGKGGAGASKAAANAAEDADSARIDAALASYQEVREWRLEELELPNEDSQGHVFLDPSTNLVYRFHEDAEWLQLYGRLLPGGRVKPVTDSAGGASAQLYAALDQHLKERGVRLSQVFAKYDLDRNHGLDVTELEGLLTDLLGPLPLSQVKHFAALLDLNGDGKVTAAEMTAVMKEVREMTAKLQARDDAAVLRVFSLVANAISRDQRAAYKLFATHDRNGNGSLEPTELASFLKALVPKTSAADLTAVLTYIQMADANGNGRIEWRELLQAVRALPVKTPRITLKPAYKPSFGLYWSPDAVQPAAGVDGASGDWPPSPIAHRPSGEADLELQLVAQQDGNLVDRESGAVYAPPAPGAGRGAWPVLIGHTDPMSRQFVPLTSLPSLTMFDDLLVIIQSPQGGKQFQDRWAAAAAKSSGGGMRGSRVGLAGAAAGAPKLKVPAILDVLLSMDEFTAQEAALLSALMRMFGGDEAHPPEDILTALTMSQQVHRQHFCPPSNYALQVLSSLSQALAGNAQAATAAAARLAPASGGLRGQLDADGLEGLMKAMLGQNGADDPALTVLVMFLGSRYPAFKGTFAVRDIFKLLRAVRCRLPGAPKGLLAGAFDVTAIVPPSAAAASPGPVPYVDQPQNSGSRINMVYSIGGRGTEGGASTSDLLRGADSYTWGSRQQRSTSAGGRALPPPPPPTCDPHRRIVELKPHQHTDGQYYAVDPVTGLLYRIAEGGEWPELVGKLLPAGQRVQPASQGGLETVCDALGRLAADEKRLEATFKMFDRDNNGSLDATELATLCRELGLLSRPEAKFVETLLDANGDHRVSFAEFVAQLKGLSQSMDRVLLRSARDVLKVLNQVALAVSQDVGVFWTAVLKEDADRNGHLDMSELTRFFRRLFRGMPSEDMRKVITYVFMMDVEKDGFVRPDELLQILHAIPMRSTTGVVYKPGFAVPADPAPVLPHHLQHPRQQPGQIPWHPPPPDAPPGPGPSPAAPPHPYPYPYPLPPYGAHGWPPHSTYPHPAPQPTQPHQQPSSPPPIAGYMIPTDSPLATQVLDTLRRPGSPGPSDPNVQSAPQPLPQDIYGQPPAMPTLFGWQQQQQQQPMSATFPQPGYGSPKQPQPPPYPYSASGFANAADPYASQYALYPQQQPQMGPYGTMTTAGMMDSTGRYATGGSRPSPNRPTRTSMLRGSMRRALDATAAASGRGPSGSIFGSLMDLQPLTDGSAGGATDALFDAFMHVARQHAHSTGNDTIVPSQALPSVILAALGSGAAALGVPSGALPEDVAYVLELLSGTLPPGKPWYSYVELRDAVGQGAYIEDCIQAGTLPTEVRLALHQLLDAVSRDGQRLQGTFAQMDPHGGGGAVGPAQQLAVAKSAVRMRPLDAAWLAAGLQMYNEQISGGYLSFDEFVNALEYFSRLSPAAPPTASTATFGPHGPTGQAAAGTYPYGATGAATAASPQLPYRRFSRSTLPGGDADPYAMSRYGGGGAPPVGPTSRRAVGMLADTRRRTTSDYYHDPAAGYGGYGNGYGGGGSLYPPPPSATGMVTGPGGAPVDVSSYFMWTHQNRQALLDRYFDVEHRKKMASMETEKEKVEKEEALRKDLQAANARLDKMKGDMEAAAAKAQETLAAVNGDVVPGSVEDLGAKIRATLDEAMAIAKTGSSSGGGGGGGGGAPSELDGKDFNEIISKLTSADWMRSAPPSLELLQKAMTLRRQALEAERDHIQRMHAYEVQRRTMDMQHAEATHLMQLQQRLLEQRLHQQTAELAQQRETAAAAAAAAAATATGQQAPPPPTAAPPPYPHMMMTGTYGPPMMPPSGAADYYTMAPPSMVPGATSYFGSPPPGSPTLLSSNSWQHYVPPPAAQYSVSAANPFNNTSTTMRPLYPGPAHD